jgi:sugar-specific transcriptional regulator TrmB/DNA-binding CsgD family transcriptional regulator
VLTALGFSADEEDVYRRLVATASATPADLAATSGRTTGEVEVLLSGLVERGLVIFDPPAFTAAPPAVALGALLRQYRDDLRAAETDLLALAEEHRAASVGRTGGDIVEVLTDVAAVRHRFAQIQERARHELRSMVVPNLSVVPARDNAAGEASLRRGVRYRAIVDREALAEPGIVAHAVASMVAGEQIRVTGRVPVKMVIADSDVAMVPLLSGQHNAPASILVHRSGLLDSLISLFEAVWERAYPLSPNADRDELVERRHEVDKLDTQIVALLLAGLTDQAVAGQLGMSLRTVQRRIHHLMDRTGAETRLQLGWHAARNGWA